MYRDSNGNLRHYSDGARREYGQRMRARESAKWHVTWITRHRLKKERYWTDAKINELLANEKATKHGTTRGGHPIMAWKREVIYKIERRKSFREWLDKRLEKMNANNSALIHERPRKPTFREWLIIKGGL